MSVHEILPCPCGSPGVVLELRSIAGTTYCVACGGQTNKFCWNGSSEKTEEEAIKTWNEVVGAKALLTSAVEKESSR